MSIGPETRRRRKQDVAERASAARTPHHCGVQGCRNLTRARIDLEAIAERYGQELSVAEFVNRSVCSACGARWPNIAISLEPGGTRGARMGQAGNIRSV